MGPREKALRASAAKCFPPTGSCYFDDPVGATVLLSARTRDALEEAIDGWEAAVVDAGDAGDAGDGTAQCYRRIEGLRAFLAEVDGAG